MDPPIATSFCLTVHVVNRLAHGVPDLSCGISHVSHRSIGCTFVGHPIVTGKIAHALLNRACYRSDLAFGTSLRAPVESLAGCAFHSVGACRIAWF